MTSHQWLVALTVFTAIPATGFPLLYGTMSPWWRSHLGRALMTKGTGMLLLVDSGLLALWLPPDSLVMKIIGGGVIILVPLGIWYQFLTFTYIRFSEARTKALDDEVADRRLAEHPRG